MLKFLRAAGYPDAERALPIGCEAIYGWWPATVTAKAREAALWLNRVLVQLLGVA
jgi:hypothetical protein